jgi:hypothetical protein
LPLAAAALKKAASNFSWFRTNCCSARAIRRVNSVGRTIAQADAAITKNRNTNNQKPIFSTEHRDQAGSPRL